MNTDPDSYIDPAICPLCGKPNQCAMAADPDAEECWCGGEKFPHELLEQVPGEAVRRACICRECLANYLARKDLTDPL